MNKPPLSVGLVGLGQMGRNHLRILSMLKGVTVAFVSDADEAAGRRVADQFGLEFRPDVDDAFREVDAVIICTPTITHEDYVRRAARSVKNIFVEKPLAHSLAASEALQELAAEKGINLQVGFIERFNPAVRELKAVLREPANVISVDFMRTNKVSSRITDVDVIVDLMIHDIDLALHVNGPVGSVFAHGLVQNEMIVFASALLTHLNGRFSRIQASRITDKKMRLVQATCADMFINCELVRKEVVITRHSVQDLKEPAPYIMSSVEETLAVRPEEALLSELQAFFVNCVTPGSVDVPQAADGVRAMSICEKIQQLVMGGEAGELPVTQEASPVQRRRHVA
jgi:predicted dehydrogenase